MDKRFTVSTQLVEAFDGDMEALMTKGDLFRISISEAELERCSGRCEQAMSNCKDVVLRVYLLGAANAFHALHEAKREWDDEDVYNRVLMLWKTDTGDCTEEWLAGAGEEVG